MFLFPADPSPLPDGGGVIDGTSPPAPDLEALLELLPEWVREFDSDLRDAMLQVWGAMANELWSAFSQVLEAQQSPRYSESTWLDELGAKRKIPRAPGETDADYRARLLSFPDRICPTAIRAIVDALVAATIAPLRAVYQEPSEDGFFLGDVDENGDQVGDWSCFWQADDQRYWGWDTEPPVVASTRRGAYWEDEPGRPLFRVILPFDVNDDVDEIFLAAEGDEFTFWMDEGEDVNFYGPESDALTERIIREVEARRGGGVPWELLIDPLQQTAI